MNSNSGKLAVVLGLVLSLVCAGLATGDDSTSAQRELKTKEKTFTGTISHVDATEQTVTAHAFLSTKTFNLADNCRVSLEDKPAATLGDLRPGQKVTVRYENSHRVLVAREIQQRNRVYHGHIDAIDVAGKTVDIKRGMVVRTFALPDDCVVLLQDNKPGSFKDLKTGHTVDVIYEPREDRRVALRIEQLNPTFVGTIRSIDAINRTVKAKNFLEEKRFNLAENCRIVTGDNPKAGLRDLRIGDRVEFTYEDKSGVLVANRIGYGTPPPALESSGTAMTDTKSP